MKWYVIVWFVVQAGAIVIASRLVVEAHRDTSALRLVGDANGRRKIARRNTRRAWARLLTGSFYAAAGVAALFGWSVGSTPVTALALIGGSLVLVADGGADWLIIRTWGDR